MAEKRRYLRLNFIGEVTVVTLTVSRISAEAAIQETAGELDTLVDEGDKKILLNLGNLEYTVALFLGKLLTFRRKVAAGEGKLKLCCIHPDLEEVFRISRLDQQFDIYLDEETALSAF